MLIIVMGSTGFEVVTALESECGFKFNAGYYVNKVLIILSEWWPERVCWTFRKVIIHADSERGHKSRI
jgi:hypothetical protein